MADKFDPYREALIVETATIWPDEYHDWDDEERRKVAEALHAAPEDAAQLQYERLHTGFCRQITVSPEDIERLG